MYFSPRAARLTTRTAAVLGALALAGCSAGAADQEASEQEPSLSVLASFYPLQYVTARVGGDLVTVSSLTPPGAEPHDLELSPRQVREVGESDLVVYLSGFQAAVDDAIAAREPQQVVDAAQTPAIAEHLAEAEAAEGEAHADEGEAEGSEVNAGSEEGEDEHGHGSEDPHFWLDPTLLAAVAADVAVALGEADPANAATYTANAEAVGDELTALDEQLAAGLSTCERDVIVVSHEAFGFLSERYALEQVGLSGLDPESEPSPARLREIRDVVEEHSVTTIVTETLVSPKVAETLAADLGIETAVLDPVESQVDPAVDYRAAMEQNLVALQTALGCS